MATKKTTKKAVTKKASTKKVTTTKKVATKKVAAGEAKVYTQAAKEKGTVKLSEKIFGVSWNSDLVHQVVIGMQANARQPIAHAKGRSEKRGGGRKPWKQKGTGRARHGSRRSPIWIGGGVTHGPTKERKFAKKINRKMRTKALYTALSQKQKDGEVLFVESISFDRPASKGARAMLNAFGGVKGYEDVSTKKKNNVFIALPEANESVARSFKNFGNIEVDETRNLNPLDVLTYKYVVLVDPSETQKILESRSK